MCELVESIYLDETRRRRAGMKRERLLRFVFFSCSSSSTFPSASRRPLRNFLSSSDVFARTRENHVKSRFRAVIYVNETLTTSTKFYSPELTLRLPQIHPRVLVHRSSSSSRLPSEQTRQAKEAKSKGKGASDEEEEEDRREKERERERERGRPWRKFPRV